MSKTTTTSAKIRRVTGTTIVVGAIGSAALAASMGATLSGFTASITNSTNTAASATLAVTETSGGATCNSYDATATCGTINKYGGTASPLAPGSSQTTTVTFQNTGSVAVGSSNLTPSACVATATNAVGASTPTTPNTSAGNLCSVLNIKVYKAATATGTPIFDNTAASFTSAVSLGTLAPNASQAYTFVVTLPSSATSAVQGQQVSQPLAWNFSQ